MQYVSEYRDSEKAQALARAIRREADPQKIIASWNFAAVTPM